MFVFFFPFKEKHVIESILLTENGEENKATEEGEEEVGGGKVVFIV